MSTNENLDLAQRIKMINESSLTEDEKSKQIYVEQLVESTRDGFKKLSEQEKSAMRTLLSNTIKESKDLTESTASSDVAQFTPILLPLVRRVMPNLIANHLVGVQPLTMPTGYMYALVNTYTGDNADKKISPTGDGRIIKCSEEPTDINPGDTVCTDAKVIYKEGLFLLVQKGSTPIEVGTVVNGSITVTELYSNEAAFLHILHNYTGPYTTSAGEKLGNDMKEVGFTVTKKSIEAKTRALKGQWTVEMYQDLQAQHGLYADNEIMNLMSYEIQAEIDREIVNFVNANATQCPDTVFNGTSIKDYDYGRWEIERYRAQAVRIAKESTIIGLETKRGAGNVLLVSPKVCTMLEQIGTFKPATVSGPSNIVQPISGGVAGVFDGKYKVVVDQYATSDYCTVLYKGANNNDALGFFAPYVPLSFTKVMDQTSGQPGVIAKTRYGITTIPGVIDPSSNDRAKTYARSFGINFQNTILA